MIPEKVTLHYKRYPNHRLYNVDSSKYVIFPDIYAKITSGHSIQVIEKETGEDVTHEVLTGIIVHICFKSEAMFTEEFLRFMILGYQNSYKVVIEQYFQTISTLLDASMRVTPPLTSGLPKSLD